MRKYMGQILQFKPRYKTPAVDEKTRLKMMAEGRVELYNCNGCNCEIEVIDNNFPDTCPGCGDELDWSEFK